MTINITTLYEGKNTFDMKYFLKESDNSGNSSLLPESKIKINTIESFRMDYLSDKELLSVKYKNLKNDL